MQEGPRDTGPGISLCPVKDGIRGVLEKIILAVMWRLKWRHLGQDWRQKTKEKQEFLRGTFVGHYYVYHQRYPKGGAK